MVMTPDGPIPARLAERYKASEPERTARTGRDDAAKKRRDNSPMARKAKAEAAHGYGREHSRSICGLCKLDPDWKPHSQRTLIVEGACGGCGAVVGKGYSECQDCYDRRMGSCTNPE